MIFSQLSVSPKSANLSFVAGFDNPSTIALLTSWVLVGIFTHAVLSQVDVIGKVFSNILSMVLTVAASSLFFHFQMSFVFVLALICVLIGICLYYCPLTQVAFHRSPVLDSRPSADKSD